MSRRTERIGEQLREALAQALHRDVRDPRVSLVSITHVDVAPDLSHAVVAWSVLDVRAETDIAGISEGLASAAPFLRRKLAKTLALRRMPELRFEHDPSIERGSEMLDLLRQLNTGAAEAEDEVPRSGADAPESVSESGEPESDG